MKKRNMPSVLLGIVVIIFAFGAYTSGEAASQTSTGRLTIFIFGIAGVVFIFKGLFMAEETTSPAPSKPTLFGTSEPPRCPVCDHLIKAEYKVCPYCGINLLEAKK